MGSRFALLTNSGSSANLLAIKSLDLRPGSRILTTAVNFPTTLNAILQCGHIPVLVDSDPRTLNINFSSLPTHRIDAIILAHTLGNPIDFGPLVFNVPLIEDCCDAVGSISRGRMVGKRGIIATVSFYPAHHMTMGEGGAILTDDPRIKKTVESYRDWGRDCWCEPGEDNTCGTRFSGEYDHKYTYSRIGYNLKITDLQAAVGVAQLERLEGFIQKRRENWAYLRKGLTGIPVEFVDPTPESDPSWFGFPFLTDQRNKLARFLDDRGIGNRPIMGGNLLRQPAYKWTHAEILGDLQGANKIHEQGIWVGCWPGLNQDQLDHTIEAIHEYF